MRGWSLTASDCQEAYVRHLSSTIHNREEEGKETPRKERRGLHEIGIYLSSTTRSC